MQNPTTAPAWQLLCDLYPRMAQRKLLDLFNEDPQRFQRFSVTFGSLFVDYSKNFIDTQTQQALLELARFQQLEHVIEQLASGHPIAPPIRAVPYLALRDRTFLPVCIDGEDISSNIRNALFGMRRLCDSIRSWHWRGYNGKPITDIVTLGVGGSGNGAEMVCRALTPYQSVSLKSHFISNADTQAIRDKLGQLHPDTTLFIISSKSFTTQETLLNAQLAKSWVTSNAATPDALQRHFIAITANREAALAFGIHEQNLLPMWDWLPGRYALWSTAGLPIALMIGMERFEQLLDGANSMDQHFVRTPLVQNIPVLLALLDLWYSNFWHTPSHAILPYSELLELLPAYLQHSLMETNGKSVDLQGQPVNYSTAPVIWGSAGTKNQHTYFQLLHQGTHLVPTDFITVASSIDSNNDTATTFLHFLAQAEALMCGTAATAQDDTLSDEQRLPGNKPSTCLLLKDLSPATLGQLLALYEHMALVQAVIWNINPFSHWGTELGKRFIAERSATRMTEGSASAHDDSTRGLLNVFRQMQQAQRHDPLNANRAAEESAFTVF